MSIAAVAPLVGCIQFCAPVLPLYEYSEPVAPEPRPAMNTALDTSVGSVRIMEDGSSMVKPSVKLHSRVPVVADRQIAPFVVGTTTVPYVDTMAWPSALPSLEW